MAEPTAQFEMSKSEAALLVILLGEHQIEADKFRVEPNHPSTIFRVNLLNRLVSFRDSFAKVI